MCVYGWYDFYKGMWFDSVCIEIKYKTITY